MRDLIVFREKSPLKMKGRSMKSLIILVTLVLISPLLYPQLLNSDRFSKVYPDKPRFTSNDPADSSENMYPLALNNSYQYLSVFNSPLEGYSDYNFEGKKIIRDTIITQKKYFAFDNSGKLYRYDRDSNKAFVRYGDVEGLYCDFNVTSGSTFIQFQPPANFQEVTVTVDYVEYFGAVRKRFSWTSYPYTRTQFVAEDIGYAGSWSSSPPPPLPTNGHTDIIGAVIYDTTGNFIYYTYGYKPEITFVPFFTLDLSGNKTFYAKIDHEYNRYNTDYGEITSEEFYIDSTFVEYFYKKDSVETVKNRRRGVPGGYENNYHFFVFTDVTLLQDGYKFCYRIGAKDKALIPQYSYSPDSGYYEAQYIPSAVLQDDAKPLVFSLEQNFPNPFNPDTKFQYSIPQPGYVIIKIFDLLGKEIETFVNEEKSAGTYELTWNAENLPSGVYIYQLRAGDFIQTKKMILLK